MLPCCPLPISHNDILNTDEGSTGHRHGEEESIIFRKNTIHLFCVPKCRLEEAPALKDARHVVVRDGQQLASIVLLSKLDLGRDELLGTIQQVQGLQETN